jgi:hypothetical protein
MHHRFAATLAEAWGKIRAIQRSARGGDWDGKRPHWPMIILRSPKGWTGPEKVDGIQVTGTWRSHQVPLSGVKDKPPTLALDDVGAGPVSMAFLPLLEPEVVKLDMHLLRSPYVPYTVETASIASAYAERTGAVVLAEGVETEADLIAAQRRASRATADITIA